MQQGRGHLMPGDHVAPHGDGVGPTQLVCVFLLGVAAIMSVLALDRMRRQVSITPTMLEAHLSPDAEALSQDGVLRPFRAELGELLREALEVGAATSQHFPKLRLATNRCLARAILHELQVAKVSVPRKQHIRVQAGVAFKVLRIGAWREERSRGEGIVGQPQDSAIFRFAILHGNAHIGEGARENKEHVEGIVPHLINDLAAIKARLVHG
mmetsp:Transcript_93662/g.269689  ORF Transcript_93662/g.269689 Transcript_93662/m.269689 type:complete len:211 (-) Transcript_93662:1271-1903(-)